ncbi:MAG: cobalamin B12-binding domain-containing protein [Planctomycetes bacterium]|nr:cobalamin B12-binding domain-containing protein [Planctomycetota bacterium]
MRILLIYPVPPRTSFPKGPWRSVWVPTGLAYIAAALKAAGHEVKVHVREEQLVRYGLNWQAADATLLELLRQYRPEMVGLSVVTPSMPEAEWIAAQVKAVCGQDVPVIVGGPHPTALPQRTLADCPDFDVVAVGEGERTMVELASGGPGPDVAGIVYRENGACRHTAPRTPEPDLDRLPAIDYDMFAMDYFTAPTRWLVRYLELSATNIRTSRGCTNRCRFCAGHLTAGLGVRFHSVESVLDRIQYAVERFGVRGIRFEDDTLGADGDRLIAICQAMRSRGLHKKIQWDGCLRVDQANAELLGEMKAAGCIQVEYGFESGSDDMLRRLGKHSSLEANRRAVRITREAGLRIFADIMIGLPGETERDIDATVSFCRWARPEVISAAQLHPLPGTPIYDALPADVRASLDWESYTYAAVPEFIVNLTAIPDDKFRRISRRLFRHFFRPWLKRQFLRDTPSSNTAERRRLRKQLRKFMFRHPLACARLPR